MSAYCILHGRIKDKTVLTISVIKCQVCCIESTAPWLTNTVQFACVVNKPIVILSHAHIHGFVSLHTWIYITKLH